LNRCNGDWGEDYSPAPMAQLLAIPHAEARDIVAKKKKDFDSRLDDITLERKVNRDEIRIYG